MWHPPLGGDTVAIQCNLYVLHFFHRSMHSAYRRSARIEEFLCIRWSVVNVVFIQRHGIILRSGWHSVETSSGEIHSGTSALDC